jgi:hypothetical protein
MMAKGLNGFDGRVIPMVSQVVERHMGAFTRELMPTLVNLARKFPVLKREFARFRKNPEFLTAALTTCFDQYGRLMVANKVASSIENAFTSVADDELNRQLTDVVRTRGVVDWRSYAMLRFIRPHPVKQSVFFENWREQTFYGGVPVHQYSTPELIDLCFYLAFDVAPGSALYRRRNDIRNQIVTHLHTHRQSDLNLDLFFFLDEKLRDTQAVRQLDSVLRATMHSSSGS